MYRLIFLFGFASARIINPYGSRDDPALFVRSDGSGSSGSFGVGSSSQGSGPFGSGSSSQGSGSFGSGSSSQGSGSFGSGSSSHGSKSFGVGSSSQGSGSFVGGSSSQVQSSSSLGGGRKGVSPSDNSGVNGFSSGSSPVSNDPYSMGSKVFFSGSDASSASKSGFGGSLSSSQSGFGGSSFQSGSGGSLSSKSNFGESKSGFGGSSLSSSGMSESSQSGFGGSSFQSGSDGSLSSKSNFGESKSGFGGSSLSSSGLSESSQSGFGSSSLSSSGLGGSSQSGFRGSSQSGFGSSSTLKCTPVFETVFRDVCEAFTDRVCTTQHRESCIDVSGENCRAVVASKQVRECFNVTELLCSLKEETKYDLIQATYTVQKCKRVKEKVCDTVYEAVSTTKDEFKCLDLETLDCQPEERTVNDETCKTTTQFDCIEEEVEQPRASVPRTDKVPSTGNSYGYGGYQYPTPVTEPRTSVQVPRIPRTVCRKLTDTNCYNTPRVISSGNCGMGTNRVCEKLSERKPIPVEKQHCHNEERKVCELEERKQPKQVRNYVYSKQCRPITRTICENADVKNLVSSCAPDTRKSCQFSPVEKCVDIPKEHCHKQAELVESQNCETVPYPRGNPPPQPSQYRR